MSGSKRLAEGERLPSPFIPTAQVGLLAAMNITFAMYAGSLLLAPLLMAMDRRLRNSGPRMSTAASRTAREVR